VTQHIGSETAPATASTAACAACAGVGKSALPATHPRCRATAARLSGTAILALLTFLVIGRQARALDLTGGPTESPPGGVTCTSSDVEPTGTHMMLQCTIANPGGFADLFFGLANNTTVNGVEMNGALPSGVEIFRYSSSTPTSITYTSSTTINNVLGSATQNVNTRLVLSLVSGTGFVIDTGGTPANNDNGDIQKLFRIAGNSFAVSIDIASNTLGIPTFGPSNTNVFNVIHKPLPPGGSTTTVSMGFYYLQCTP